MSTDISPQNLRERRKSAGLTQFKLAVAADVSLSYIAMIERGYRPSADVLNRLTRVIAAATTNEAALAGGPATTASVTGAHHASGY